MKMFSMFLLTVTILVAALPAWGTDVPVYANRTLVVPAVIIHENNTVAGNVTMELQQDGKWTLVGAQLMNRVPVQQVDVQVTDDGKEAHVSIKGYLPDGCTSLGDVIEARYGDTFHIVITGNRPEGMMCTQQIVPFEQTVSLDIEGLEPGRYEVRVNKVTAHFEIGQDQLVCCRSYCCTCAPQYRDQFTYSLVPASRCRRPEGLVGGNCYEVVERSLCER